MSNSNKHSADHSLNRRISQACKVTRASKADHRSWAARDLPEMDWLSNQKTTLLMNTNTASCSTDSEYAGVESPEWVSLLKLRHGENVDDPPVRTTATLMANGDFRDVSVVRNFLFGYVAIVMMKDTDLRTGMAACIQKIGDEETGVRSRSWTV